MHLANDFTTALRVINEYENVQTDDSKTDPYEQSELIMYKIQIMMEAGLLEVRALSRLYFHIYFLPYFSTTP